ncbi:hypothetical protein TNCV_4392951 [Trichonephila clavipes]|nr:hypothetical protein TNCV_4392951 [Trichonephila clavipes]
MNIVSRILTETYGDETLSGALVFERHKRFSGGISGKMMNVLDTQRQSLSNHGSHVFYRRKIRRASRPGKQFNLVIDEEPLDNEVPCIVAHYPVEIWLWPSPEGKEGQLAPTPRRCSAGCLKYRQCILEKCESDIQYRLIP